jgi:hypothetical protein
MTDDPVGRVFLLILIVVFLLIALRPDWFIKIASYGRRGIGDLNGFQIRVLRLMRPMGVVGAIWCAGCLLWWLVRR